MSMKNKKQFKVSPTLLNSYLNMKNKVYKDSEENFLKTLNRIPLEDNFFLRRGNYFEDRVTRNWREPFHKVVKGCDTQVYVEKDVEMENRDFDIKINGFIDFVSKDKKIVYDTKRVNRWDDDKYDSSVQHDFYMWAIPESEKFYYLVGEGRSWFADNYFQVEYVKLSEEENKKLFVDLINEFLDYLIEKDLLDTYKKHYFSKPYKKKNKTKDKANKKEAKK